MRSDKLDEHDLPAEGWPRGGRESPRIFKSSSRVLRAAAPHGRSSTGDEIARLDGLFAFRGHQRQIGDELAAFASAPSAPSAVTETCPTGGSVQPSHRESHGT